MISKEFEQDYEKLAHALIDAMCAQLDGKSHEYVTTVGINALIAVVSNFVFTYTGGNLKASARFLERFTKFSLIATQTVKKLHEKKQAFHNVH